MTPAAWNDLLAALKQDEGPGPIRDGVCLPYRDPVGKTTIGYGHNLTDNGLKMKFAQLLLEDDATDHVMELTRRFPIVQSLSDRRQVVLGCLAYNLGVPTLADFHNMWAAIGVGDFATAAKELLDSKAARQLPVRYARLAQELEDG